MIFEILITFKRKKESIQNFFYKIIYSMDFNV